MLEREGLTVYKQYTNHISAKYLNAAAAAPGPEVVAKTIWKAANSKNNRLRYSVGSGAPFVLFLKRILPDTWFMGIIRFVLK